MKPRTGESPTGSKPKVDFVLDVSTKIPKVKPPRCDICLRVATWRHPKGGLRCRS